MNHPHILNEAEFQALIRKDNFKSRVQGTLLALVMVALICIQSGCDEQALQDEQNVATAFFPTKPSRAQQVAYREEAREDLALSVLMDERK